MKLSEAIRLGSLLRPQARHQFFINGKTCALGAAQEASGMFPKNIDELYGRYPLTLPGLELLKNAFPILDVCVEYPVGSKFRVGSSFQKIKNTVWHIVTYLNDTCRWDREKIAGWVESVELDLSTINKKEMVGANETTK